jgi:hypothetical protein
MNRSITEGMPSFLLPPPGFGISTRFTASGLYVPSSNYTGARVSELVNMKLNGVDFRRSLN